MVMERQAARRVGRFDTSRFGLWVVPGRLAAADGVLRAPADVCLRVIPLVGPQRGRGGSSCVPTTTFIQTATILTVLSAGARGALGYAPHEAVIGGLLPDGVTRVKLVLRGGASLTQEVTHNGYLFDTTRPAQALVYDTEDGMVRQRLVTCQSC